MNSTS